MRSFVASLALISGISLAHNEIEPSSHAWEGKQDPWSSAHLNALPKSDASIDKTGWWSYTNQFRPTVIPYEPLKLS